jgi:hypothetical protein
MLDYVGIKSYYTKLYSGVQPRELLTSLPSQQFNHVILAVPVDNDTLWLENTDNTGPFGYNGTSIQNRMVLLIEKGNSRLVRIPAMDLRDVACVRRMKFDIDIIGNANVRLQFLFRGYRFDLYNSLITQYNQEIQNNFVHDNLPFPSFELEEWKIIKKNRDARQVVLEAAITTPKVFRAAGDEHYISVIPAEIPAFTAPGIRRLPVSLPFPISISDTLIYHIPPGYNTTILPSNTSLESRFGAYRIVFKTEGQTITVVRDFTLFPGTIAKEDYPVFYKFLSTIKTDEKRKILIRQ